MGLLTACSFLYRYPYTSLINISIWNTLNGTILNKRALRKNSSFSFKTRILLLIHFDLLWNTCVTLNIRLVLLKSFISFFSYFSIRISCPSINTHLKKENLLHWIHFKISIKLSLLRILLLKKLGLVFIIRLLNKL
jgi:hypothetical protein